MMFCKAGQRTGAGLTTSMSDEKWVSRTMPTLTADSVEILYLPCGGLGYMSGAVQFPFSH